MKLLAALLNRLWKRQRVEEDEILDAPTDDDETEREEYKMRVRRVQRRIDVLRAGAYSERSPDDP